MHFFDATSCSDSTFCFISGGFYLFIVYLFLRSSSAKVQKTDNITKEKKQKNVLNAYFQTFSTYLDTICNIQCYPT